MNRNVDRKLIYVAEGKYEEENIIDTKKKIDSNVGINYYMQII